MINQNRQTQRKARKTTKFSIHKQQLVIIGLGMSGRQQHSTHFALIAAFPKPVISRLKLDCITDHSFCLGSIANTCFLLLHVSWLSHILDAFASSPIEEQEESLKGKFKGAHTTNATPQP